MFIVFFLHFCYTIGHIYCLFANYPVIRLQFRFKRWFRAQIFFCSIKLQIASVKLNLMLTSIRLCFKYETSKENHFHA